MAWIVNAQDCQWAAGLEPTGDLHAGSQLRIDRGLLKLRFRSGAQVVIEGPAEIELLSSNAARMTQGRLTARVPESAIGFKILSPQGEIADLGTEFGVSVADDGATKVLVYEGEVEARLAGRADPPASIKQGHKAVLDRDGPLCVSKTAPDEEKEFTRAIVPAPVFIPRTLSLNFRQAVEGSLGDASRPGSRADASPAWHGCQAARTGPESDAEYAGRRTGAPPDGERLAWSIHA